jgi:hypothetical protein
MFHSLNPKISIKNLTPQYHIKTKVNLTPQHHIKTKVNSTPQYHIKTKLSAKTPPIPFSKQN